MKTKYPHLAEPIKIGEIELKNRFMKNGTGFFWDDPQSGGFMNDRYLDYFDALAAGGTGLISSATGPLTRDVKSGMPGFKIVADEYIPGWAKWADIIHRHDAVAFAQLFHLGPMTPILVTAPPGVSASAIPEDESPRPSFGAFRAMSVPEIEDAIDMFASAAERLKKAGIDGVELNAACNHLINNFLSRAWNRREDEWGPQTMENRTRLATSIIKEIKRRNGADWPLIMLFNAQEIDLTDGTTIAESQEFAQIFVQAGADALEVRAEYYTWTKQVERRQSLHFPDMYLYPHQPGPINPYVDANHLGAGANLPMAAAIKQAVAVPVISVGRLDWNIGERAIAEGKVDIISLNRRLLADPGLPKKVLAGDTRDINPCNSCMTCFDACEHFDSVHCRVNTSLGKEREYAITMAQVKKKVLVIGGGPAGMEAARVAALRGHEVVLFDKQHILGGSMPVAALVKGPREDIVGLIAYLSRQIRKAGVTVRLGVPVTRATIAAEHPDVIIAAAGGTHDIPQIPGISGKNVLTGEKLHKLAKMGLRFVSPGALRGLEALPVARNLMIGKRVVVMGAHLHGCQTAEYLLDLGKKVTIVDTGTPEVVGQGLLDVFIKPYLLYWLEDHGVEFLTDVTYERVTPRGLIVKTKDGKERLLPADTVLTALPLKPNKAIADMVEGQAPEVHVIGDAGDPQLIVDAMAAGATIGHRI